MIQTALAINGLDCTIDSGNTPEEYEAIAVTFLRTAEAIRNREEGRFECRGERDKLLASVLLHDCGPNCDGDISDMPTIERLTCVSEHRLSLRTMSLSIIDQYRRASRGKESRPAQE
jgi:hypothetical protein